MRALRYALPLLYTLAALACVEPKPGTDHTDSTGDAGSPADVAPRPDGSAAPDADVDPGDATANADALPDAEVDSGTPPCVPSGPEVCDNGADEDCDKFVDCQDSDCGRCLAVPAGFVGGVLIDATTPCPAGFVAQEQPLFSGLDPGVGCAGSCTCSPNPTRCLGEVFVYSTQAQCAADSALTGGQRYTALITETCTTMPVADGFPGGFRLGNWTVEQSCAPSGTASPSPYSWRETKKLCVAQMGELGCGPGAVCFPSAELPNACAMSPGGAPCEGEFTERSADWYTGLMDSRSCGGCECNAAGGTCQFARVSMGSDWVCTDAVQLSTQNPQSCGSAYSPPARVTGNPGDPTCTPTAPQSGDIAPTGQQTLCCLP